MPEDASERIEAPFTEEQVRGLRAYQASGVMHPFTCRSCSSRDPLAAKARGFVCEACGHVQKWAHAFMAEGAPPDPLDALLPHPDDGN